MPDARLPHPKFSSGTSADQYRIMRKGSRYNILGPQGRVFTKYQSASVAGPRWEELTHLPWPYDSSAFERGMRLWELGLIDRDQIGKRNIKVASEEPEQEPATKQPSRVGRKDPKQAPPKTIVLTQFTTLALPAPKIDLDKHQQRMQALKRNPGLLFQPQIRQALQHEVEYNRPQALWAQQLLGMVARFEKRQRSKQQRVLSSSASVTAKHIAWQQQRLEQVGVV